MSIPDGVASLTKAQIKVLQDFANLPLAGGGKPGDPPKSNYPHDLEPHEPELEAPILPKFKPTKDKTKNLMGFGGGDPADHRNSVEQLSAGDQIRLLLANNIIPRQPTDPDADAVWEVPAFAIGGGDMEAANNNAVLIGKISFKKPQVRRTDHAAFSYKLFESHLQSYTVVKTQLEFGIPEIFRATASYSDTSGHSKGEKNIEIFSEASQLIPKAWIVLDEDEIKLDPKFLSKVQNLSGSDEEKTRQLLDLLKVWGHFVPISMLLGGRLTFSTSTTLNDKSEFTTVKREFKAAAKARFSVEGVPIAAAWAMGVGNEETATSKTADQAKSLDMEVKGGDENLLETDPTQGARKKKWKAGNSGKTWVGSLGRYQEWTVIGFYESSLVPIIKFLPQTSRDLCIRLLREYFVNKLSLQKSGSAGHKHGKDLVEDSGAPESHRVKGITDIEVQSGARVDRLKVTYEVYEDNGKVKSFPTKWVGSDTGRIKEHIKLRHDEELTAIETWTDVSNQKEPLLRRVAFRTSKNRRFPDDSDGFYGDKGSASDVFKTIEAPRIRAIIGSNGAFIHRIGLEYAPLDGDAISREFLLAIEPYLFPKKDYGVLSDR